MKTLILKVAIVGLFGLIVAACGNSGSNNNANCVNSAYPTTQYTTPGYPVGYNPALAAGNCTGINGINGINGLATGGYVSCMGATCYSPIYGSGTCMPNPVNPQFSINCHNLQVTCPQLYGGQVVTCL